MLDFKLQTIVPALQRDPIARASAELAQALGSMYANQLRTAIARKKAIATGKTLGSVKNELVVDSASRGIFRRAVTANRSWQNIQGGRRAGAKMPVRKVGSRFEPFPELVEWFQALGIPKAAWFPILRKIAKNGIKPRNIRDLAVRLGNQRLYQLSQNTGNKIAELLAKTAVPQQPK